jgi:hypothetical protein
MSRSSGRDRWQRHTDMTLNNSRAPAASMQTEHAELVSA